MILDYKKKVHGPVELLIDLNVTYYPIRWLGDLGNEGKICVGIRCHTFEPGRV